MTLNVLRFGGMSGLFPKVSRHSLARTGREAANSTVANLRRPPGLCKRRYEQRAACSQHLPPSGHIFLPGCFCTRISHVLTPRVVRNKELRGAQRMTTFDWLWPPGIPTKRADAEFLDTQGLWIARSPRIHIMAYRDRRPVSRITNGPSNAGSSAGGQNLRGTQKGGRAGQARGNPAP